MADEADLSQNRQELEDELRRKYTTRPSLEVGHTGYCLNCGEALKGEQRWCDVSCRNDWVARTKK